jgi:hypothetical protein
VKHSALIAAAATVGVLLALVLFEGLCVYLQHRRALKERLAAERLSLRIFAQHVAEQKRKWQ